MMPHAVGYPERKPNSTGPGQPPVRHGLRGQTEYRHGCEHCICEMLALLLGSSNAPNTNTDYQTECLSNKIHGNDKEIYTRRRCDDDLGRGVAGSMSTRSSLRGLGSLAHFKIIYLFTGIYLLYFNLFGIFRRVIEVRIL